MARFLFQRFLHMIPLLIGISFIAFGVMQLAPGDFLSALTQDPRVSPEMIAQMRTQYGLDRPWYAQYFLWLGNAARLNFGYSLAYHVPVTTLLGQRLCNTFLLSFCSLVFAWSLAIPLGIVAAVRRNSWPDRALSLIAFLGISFPGFFLALLLLLFAQRTGWFPIGGMQSAMAELLSPWGRFLDLLHHLALPVLVLGSAGLAGIMRQMRGSLLDTLRENYITAARARGLPERMVILKHATRNAINPLITVFGYSLAGLLSGAALVENVMAWPGLGRLILEAVQSRDLYLVMGSFCMSAVLLLLGNLVGDLLLAATDPRIKFGH
jgi:peptide/nickel transport system permease protein